MSKKLFSLISMIMVLSMALAACAPAATPAPAAEAPAAEAPTAAAAAPAAEANWQLVSCSRPKTNPAGSRTKPASKTP